MNETLQRTLRELRLSGLSETLDVRLTQAAGSGMNHAEFLELILADELAVRKDRQLARRLKAADFREARRLEDFDWGFNRAIKRQEIFELAAGHYLRQAEDVLFVGPPGVGKSHLAQALGYEAVKQGFRVYYRSVFDLVRDFLQDEGLNGAEQGMKRFLTPDLLIIDDMGIKQLPAKSGEYLFEVILRRHELRSTIMTSNRPLEDWGKLLGDVPAAAAILDRFLHHARIVAIKGKSYRLKDRPTRSETKPRDTAEPTPSRDGAS